jgi:hypothetical protein
MQISRSLQHGIFRGFSKSSGKLRVADCARDMVYVGQLHRLSYFVGMRYNGPIYCVAKLQFEVQTVVVSFRVLLAESAMESSNLEHRRRALASGSHRTSDRVRILLALGSAVLGFPDPGSS